MLNKLQLKTIINWMIKEGVKSTLYGSYSFEIKEIEQRYNIKLSNKDITKIMDKLMERNEVAEVEEYFNIDTDELLSIDIYFFTNYCPNLVD